MSTALAYTAGVLTPLLYLWWQEKKRRKRVEAYRRIVRGEDRERVPLLERLKAEGIVREHAYMEEARSR